MKKIIGTKFLSLYKTKQGFIYAQRRNINSVAVLCFKKEKKQYKFLIRYQPLPVVNTIKHFKWDDCFACPITGSFEKNKKAISIAINEVYEEANLSVNKKHLINQCKFVTTTQMNETVFCFVFDVTGLKSLKKKQGDGSIFENVSYNKWLTYRQIKNIVKGNNNKLYLSALPICLQLFEEKHGKIKN